MGNSENSNNLKMHGDHLPKEIEDAINVGLDCLGSWYCDCKRETAVSMDDAKEALKATAEAIYKSCDSCRCECTDIELEQAEAKGRSDAIEEMLESFQLLSNKKFEDWLKAKRESK